MQITIPAKIAKADITPIGQLKGMANLDRCCFDGNKVHEPRSLVFRGFAGAYCRKALCWVGVYRFDVGGGESCQKTMVVADLPFYDELQTTSAATQEAAIEREVMSDA